MPEINVSEIMPTLIAIIAIVAVVAVLLLIVRNVVKNIKRKQNLSQEGETFLRIISNIVRGVIIAVALIAVLQACGVNISATVAGIGIAGVVASMSLQNYIKDVVAGLRIVNDKYFMINDVIEFNGMSGIVVEMNIHHTKIKLIDGSIVSLSNRLIESCRKYPQPWPIGIEIPLSYDVSPDDADKVLLEAAEKCRQLENVTDVRYDGLICFRDSSVLYKIVVFCPADKRYFVSKDCYRCVFDELNKNGLSIPYNTYHIINDKNNVDNSL